MLDRRASAVSLLVHGLAFLLVIGIARMPRTSPSNSVSTPPAKLVWISSLGPGGGGGGGGDQKPLPPRPAATPPPKPAPTPIPKPVEPEPVPSLEAVPIATPPTLLAGAIDSTQPTLDTRGLGDGAGVNGGKGNGADKGDGNGLGPGKNKGIGGDTYRPGNGVSSPKVLNAVRPSYTAEAMRARISGSVWLECVVEPNGTVDRCRLSRSLDPNLGLDQEALKAAQKWTFEPGKKGGEAVPVQVTIELAFSLR